MVSSIAFRMVSHMVVLPLPTSLTKMSWTAFRMASLYSWELFEGSNDSDNLKPELINPLTLI